MRCLCPERDREVNRLHALATSISELCDEVDRVAGPPGRPTTDGVRRELGQRLRVAVVGRVKAGKSTLVNTLIGRDVAPTSERECTRITTHYTFGSPERGELVLTSGECRAVPLDGGALPEELPVPVEEIEHAVIYLQAASLEHVTLIDTPGLATTTTENEETTRRAILGHRGARQADAVVYVFHNVPYLDDVEFLKEWADVTDTPGESAASAIGVLSHADLVGGSPWDGEDPLVLARQQASDIAKLHGAQLGTVVPLAGLMAESASVGRIRERDARALAALAAVDDFDLEMRDASDADARYGEVSAAEVADVVARVGEYGLRYGRVPAQEGTRSLVGWLERESGLYDVRRALHTRYIDRAPYVKARAGILALERLAWAWGAPPRLKELVAEARLRPELHGIRELAALERLAATLPGHPLVAELERQIGSVTDEDCLGEEGRGLSRDDQRKLVIRRIGETRRMLQSTNVPIVQNACRVLERSYTLLAKRLS